MTSPANQNRLTQLFASKMGARLFRMAVGFGWIASDRDTLKADIIMTVIMKPGDVLLRQARPFKAGEKGMSDNGGWVSVIVTPDMIGKPVAVSLWVEDKSGRGVSTTEQKAWIRFVRAQGGRAGVSRCDDDTAAIIRGEIRD
jgi:hypothetical protein